MSMRAGLRSQVRPTVPSSTSDVKAFYKPTIRKYKQRQMSGETMSVSDLGNSSLKQKVVFRDSPTGLQEGRISVQEALYASLTKVRLVWIFSIPSSCWHTVNTYRMCWRWGRRRRWRESGGCTTVIRSWWGGTGPGWSTVGWDPFLLTTSGRVETDDNSSGIDFDWLDWTTLSPSRTLSPLPELEGKLSAVFSLSRSPSPCR